MSRKQKVLIGLSGGVDSSVAAWLLKEAGYEVIGVTMSIWDGAPMVTGKHACYGPDEEEEIAEAQAIADYLHIPYHVFSCAAEYKQLVLQDFRAAYLAGHTPNPCIRCNQLIKFGLLPLLAEKGGVGYDFFATGHYARVIYDQGSRRFLLKTAADSRKDQTYFIYRLAQEQLSRTLFPLGDLTKQAVRQLARDAGIPAVDKEESQDFYGGDYTELLNLPPQSGTIVRADGTLMGQHQGYWNYTIGQRKGLGVAFTEPLYVIEIRPKTNQVVVGTRSETFQSDFRVTDLHWISFDSLTQPMEVMCKIRSAQPPKPATIEPLPDNAIRVTVHQPIDAVTPGQSAVFYTGDVVAGGGIISTH